QVGIICRCTLERLEETSLVDAMKGHLTCLSCENRTRSRKGITMHIDIRPAVLTLVLPLFAACSAAQSPADRLSSELEKVAVEEMKADGIPGAGIGVVSGGKILLAKGFGVSSVETGVPVTADTLFRLGYTTKMFTDSGLG